MIFKCHSYYNNTTKDIEFVQSGVEKIHEDDTTYTKVSFMIFRTGSVLIVGKCNEDILMNIYEFLKTMLKKEYHLIRQTKSVADIANIKVKKNKIRKKKITISI